MVKKSRVRLALIAATALAVSLTGCAQTGQEPGQSQAPTVPNDTVIDRFGDVEQTVGASGAVAVQASTLDLTDAERAQLKEGGFRAAVLWHELSAWSAAAQAGIEDTFKELGIELVATTDAGFDSAVQADQVLSTLALKPDLIVTQPVDPALDAAAWQPAVDAGVTLVYAEQPSEGFTHGEEYHSVVGDDIFKIGQLTGDAMCTALENKGKVGIVYYDANFHSTNFRDNVFQSVLAEKCPDVEIVAKQGFSDPNKAEEIASSMLVRHPDLGGIYVSWASPAQGVLAALRNAGNTTTKVVTIDLDDIMATDMASDGNTAAIIVPNTYAFGRAMALTGAYGLIGKEAPEFVVVDVVQVTKANIEDGYKAWNQEVPAAVLSALK